MHSPLSTISASVSWGADMQPLGGVERVMGIEPTLAAWEAAVLPLNYTRLITQLYMRSCAAYCTGPGPAAAIPALFSFGRARGIY